MGTDGATQWTHTVMAWALAVLISSNVFAQSEEFSTLPEAMSVR